MNWGEAEINLRQNIRLNEHLDRNHDYKIVVSVPPSPCNRLKEEGFRVRVGANSVIDISIEMLRAVFDASVRNNRIYNSSVFLDMYPRKLINKPCYVHSVGKLFENSGVATKINKREYRIL